MTSILLQTLADDLEPLLREQLMAEPEIQQDILAYLSHLLVNDELLSTENFSTTTSDDPSRQKTLMEEIAELDQQHHLVSKEMAAETDENRDLIVGISHNIDEIKLRLASTIPTQLESILLITDAGDNRDRLAVPVNEKLEEATRSHDMVLANIDSVLDFLELPTLCKLCVSQGNYQESLEISMLVQSLLIRFPTLSIFQRISDQVDVELEIMAKGLVKLLNTNLKQNQILKIFQILSRLNLSCIASSTKSSIVLPVSKEESAHKNRFLKLIYLNARFRFIVQELENLAPLVRFNRLTYLKRSVETYREHIFSSLSIYYAIFPASKSVASENDDRALIYQYVKNLALRLVKEIREHFPQVYTASGDADDDAEKDGFILQIVYLCKSVAKFGVNFETMLMCELCYSRKTGISLEDWERNAAKVE